MLSQNTTAPPAAPAERVPAPVGSPPESGAWFRLSISVAVLAGVAGALGLTASHRIYGHETRTLYDAATAQDIVTLLVVAPLLAAVALSARHGSVAARACLAGLLAFAAYNDAIYAFSVHFGPLFLGWVAGLGLSVYALVAVLATTDKVAITHRLGTRTQRGTAWFLIAVAAFFAVLWLKEIVPDLLAGRPSTSAADWHVPTNPVHVLDLALFLPAVITTGVLLLRRHPLGYSTAAAQLVWLALTCVPILVTPVVAAVRGDSPGWAVVPPVGALLVAVLVVLRRLLRQTASNSR